MGKADNRIRLEGASNFRDLGGYMTRDGRVVSRGKIFRSSHFADLLPHDAEALRQIGVRLVVDLRGKTEGDRFQSKWLSDLDTEQIRADISTRQLFGEIRLLEILRQNPTVGKIHEAMIHVYRRLPTACGPALKQLICGVAEGKTPAIFHCTHGRDRTGMVAAMLLQVLDVPRETVVTDYLTSNECFDIERAVEVGLTVLRKELGIDVDRAVLEYMNRARREYIEASFCSMDEEYGSGNAYLLAFGIDHPLIVELRRQLLEPVQGDRSKGGNAA